MRLDQHLRELRESPEPETHPEYEMRDALLHILEYLAEREATPPSAGVGDAVTESCGVTMQHEQHTWRETTRRHFTCPGSPLPTPPPAPVDEPAVEALARDLWRRHHDAVLAADRNGEGCPLCVPGTDDACPYHEGYSDGYGRTGASVGAGEARLRALVTDWQANGNGSELGNNETDRVWFTCARQLLAALDTP